MADGSFVAGPPGSVSTPEAGAETGQYPAGKVTPFHSHPSGTSGGGPQLDPFGGNSSIGSSSVVRYRQAPSILDVNKASSILDIYLLKVKDLFIFITIKELEPLYRVPNL